MENLSTTYHGPRPVAFGAWVGSSFTTGSGAYSLEAATLWFRRSTVPSNTNLFLRLYSNNSGNPGTLITSFNNPTLPLPTPAANTTFSLTTPQALTASTTYWLISGISSGTDGQYDWGYTNSTLQTGLPGWSIGDNVVTSTNQGGNWNSAISPVMFSLTGTEAVPEPLTILGTGVVLGGIPILKKEYAKRKKKKDEDA